MLPQLRLPTVSWFLFFHLFLVTEPLIFKLCTAAPKWKSLVFSGVRQCRGLGALALNWFFWDSNNISEGSFFFFPHIDTVEGKEFPASPHDRAPNTVSAATRGLELHGKSGPYKNRPVVPECWGVCAWLQHRGSHPHGPYLQSPGSGAQPPRGPRRKWGWQTSTAAGTAGRESCWWLYWWLGEVQLSIWSSFWGHKSRWVELPGEKGVKLFKIMKNWDKLKP